MTFLRGLHQPSCGDNVTECKVDRRCLGLKEVVFICLGTEENPWNGNNRTGRPSAQSSRRGDSTFMHLNVSFLLYHVFFLKKIILRPDPSWRLKRCSAPSLWAAASTVPSTSPRWWARAQPTRSRRPVGRVRLSLVTFFVCFSSVRQTHLKQRPPFAVFCIFPFQDLLCSANQSQLA